MVQNRLTLPAARRLKPVLSAAEASRAPIARSACADRSNAAGRFRRPVACGFNRVQRGRIFARMKSVNLFSGKIEPRRTQKGTEGGERLSRFSAVNKYALPQVAAQPDGQEGQQNSQQQHQENDGDDPAADLPDLIAAGDPEEEAQGQPGPAQHSHRVDHGCCH